MGKNPVDSASQWIQENTAVVTRPKLIRRKGCDKVFTVVQMWVTEEGMEARVILQSL